MYCSNCGNEDPEGRKFCRSCGLSLQAIAPTYSGESPTKETAGSSVEPVSRFQAAWQNPFVYALLLIVLGIIVAVVGDKALRSQTTHDIGTIIALLGVGLLGLKGVMMIVAPPRPSPPTKRVTQVENTSELIPKLLSAELPSVTENTTRHLDARIEGGEKQSRDTQPTL